MKQLLFLFLILCICTSCNESALVEKVGAKEPVYFDWSAANVYFPLTDRFNNGDTSKDNFIKRNEETGKLRDFKGGDFTGIIQKIDDSYFTDLGVNVIWLTTIWEQIHGRVDEGT
jgi:alpha-amylase